MKLYKKISVITLLLISIIIMLISFIGFYKQKEYKIVNVINKYLLGMEFDGTRNINYIIDDGTLSETIYDKDGNIVEREEGKEYTEENGYNIVEEKINKKENLTKENYILSKKILEKRLDELLKNEKYKEYKQYEINQNKNGNIFLKIPNKAYYDYVVESIVKTGKFEMVDSTTKEVLMNNSDIKKSDVVYNTEEDGKIKIYLQISFNEAGAKKLEKISKVYIKTEETEKPKEVEETNNEEVVEKKVSVNFDDATYMTTYFGETMKTGIINIPIGQDSDTTKITEYEAEAKGMSILINTGLMPVAYKVTIYEADSIINQNMINIFAYVLISIYIIYFIYNIIKFKLIGAIIGILQIGYLALLLLILRYVNVIITLEGIIGIIMSLFISILFANILLKNKNKESYINLLINFIFKVIPIYIISIVFAFGKTLNVSSFGIVMFWGMIIGYIYNIIFIKTIIENSRKD